MSDREPRDFAVNIHDDDEDPKDMMIKIDSSENSPKSKCCFCRIHSIISRLISGVKLWLLTRVFNRIVGDDHRHQVETTRSKYRPLQQFDEEELKEEWHSLKARLSDSEIDVKRLETEVKRLETKFAEKEVHLKNVEKALEDERREKSTATLKLKQERQEKENALKSLEEERLEKERALTRLSAVAGDKLRLNNPGIADLSDENRPNKLAEKFSELYDNEWTEVFEALELENFEEEKIIEMLLELLKEIYNSCLRIARNQRESLIEAIAKPSKSEVQLEASPEGMLSKVIDLQKQTAAVAFSDVKKTIFHMKTMSQFTDHKVKQKYMERCVQLCWMMSIQDPPMMLDFGPAQDEEVDKNIFRMYTKQGDRVDFIVWPAVFLHENGPLVQKGVLQPK
ncbi:reticulocyte-binding protein homolog 2a-like [Saccostrea echinata]|uniref:reticulocyte-binding protein homolog 2a-like n=1 Tax=Saccostrea echinata TaxID=191078 RepID=UPI002A82B80D|nr:reticulocyte-binding protein homolog 2a-like [Saccostrea echinata]